MRKLATLMVATLISLGATAFLQNSFPFSPWSVADWRIVLPEIAQDPLGFRPLFLVGAAAFATATATAVITALLIVLTVLKRGMEELVAAVQNARSGSAEKRARKAEKVQERKAAREAKRAQKRATGKTARTDQPDVSEESTSAMAEAAADVVGKSREKPQRKAGKSRKSEPRQGEEAEDAEPRVKAKKNGQIGRKLGAIATTIVAGIKKLIEHIKGLRRAAKEDSETSPTPQRRRGRIAELTYVIKHAFTSNYNDDEIEVVEPEGSDTKQDSKAGRSGGGMFSRLVRRKNETPTDTLRESAIEEQPKGRQQPAFDADNPGLPDRILEFYTVWSQTPADKRTERMKQEAEKLNRQIDERMVGEVMHRFGYRGVNAIDTLRAIAAGKGFGETGELGIEPAQAMEKPTADELVDPALAGDEKNAVEKDPWLTNAGQDADNTSDEDDVKESESLPPHLQLEAGLQEVEDDLAGDDASAGTYESGDSFTPSVPAANNADDEMPWMTQGSDEDSADGADIIGDFGDEEGAQKPPHEDGREPFSEGIEEEGRERENSAQDWDEDCEDAGWEDHSPDAVTIENDLEGSGDHDTYPDDEEDVSAYEAADEEAAARAFMWDRDEPQREHDEGVASEDDAGISDADADDDIIAGDEGSASTHYSEDEVDETIASMGTDWLHAVVGEGRNTRRGLDRQLQAIGLQGLTNPSNILPTLWAQLDRIVDYQSKAFAWQQFGETPPEEFETEEQRREFLLKLATSIVTLREEVGQQTVDEILEKKAGSEHAKWLGGRADVVLQSLMRGGEQADTSALMGGEAANGSKFIEYRYRDAWRVISPIVREYRERPQADGVKSFRSTQTNAGRPGEEIDDAIDVADLLIGDTRGTMTPEGRQATLVGVMFCIVPKGEWTAVKDEGDAPFDDRVVLRAGQLAVSLRDRSQQIFTTWAEQRGFAPVPVLHLVLEPGASVDGMTEPAGIAGHLNARFADVVGAEFRAQPWSAEEWAELSKRLVGGAAA